MNKHIIVGLVVLCGVFAAEAEDSFTDRDLRLLRLRSRRDRLDRNLQGTLGNIKQPLRVA